MTDSAFLNDDGVRAVPGLFAQCALMRASFLIGSFASAFGPLYSIAAAHVLLRRALREPHGQSEGTDAVAVRIARVGRE